MITIAVLFVDLEQMILLESTETSKPKNTEYLKTTASDRLVAYTILISVNLIFAIILLNSRSFFHAFVM